MAILNSGERGYDDAGERGVTIHDSGRRGMKIQDSAERGYDNSGIGGEGVRQFRNRGRGDMSNS